MAHFNAYSPIYMEELLRRAECAGSWDDLLRFLTENTMDKNNVENNEAAGLFQTIEYLKARQEPFTRDPHRIWVKLNQAA